MTIYATLGFFRGFTRCEMLLDALERQFVAECRGWFSDIRLVTFYAGRTAMLCYCYNWSTRPTAYRTEREHRIASAIARWCRKQLAGRGGWHEMESGKLWCVGH